MAFDWQSLLDRIKEKQTAAGGIFGASSTSSTPSNSPIATGGATTKTLEGPLRLYRPIATVDDIRPYDPNDFLNPPSTSVPPPAGTLPPFSPPSASLPTKPQLNTTFDNPPDWVIPPTPGRPQSQIVKTLTNPITGEQWLAPGGGWMVDPSLSEAADTSTNAPTSIPGLSPTQPGYQAAEPQIIPDAGTGVTAGLSPTQPGYQATPQTPIQQGLGSMYGRYMSALPAYGYNPFMSMNPYGSYYGGAGSPYGLQAQMSGIGSMGPSYYGGAMSPLGMLANMRGYYGQ